VRKEVFGLTKKELIIAGFFVASSLALIIYSSIKLIHNHYQSNNLTYSEIHNQSTCLTYLNDLNTFTLNTQRNSVNLLVYKSNVAEVSTLKKSIEKNRDSLLFKLNHIDNNNFNSPNERTDLLNAGLNYLSINNIFLTKFTANTNVDSLSIYNLEKMRPAVRLFTDLIRRSSAIVVRKIQDTNNSRTNVFSQLEFWLLLIGLAPYIYFFYRIIALIARMILWELFS
jgi:hypothetical protein